MERKETLVKAQEKLTIGLTEGVLQFGKSADF